MVFHTLPPLCRPLFHLQLLVPLLSVFLFHHFFRIMLCSPQCLNRRELLCIIIQISLPEGKLLRSHHLSPLCSCVSVLICLEYVLLSCYFRLLAQPLLSTLNDPKCQSVLYSPHDDTLTARPPVALGSYIFSTRIKETLEFASFDLKCELN